MLAKIKSALTLMCVVYTVIISVMFLAGWAVSDSASLFVPTPSKALLMLLFSGILGFASLLLSRDGTGAVRLILHFVISTAAYVITFVVGGGFPVTGGTSVIAVLMFIAVYAVVMAVRAVILRKHRQKTAEKLEYTSVFK